MSQNEPRFTLFYLFLGVCSAIKLCSSSFQTDNLPEILYVKTSDVLEGVSTPSGNGDGNGAYVWIFDDQADIGILSHSSIFVETDRVTVVKLTHHRISRLTTGNKKCKGNSAADKRMLILAAKNISPRKSKFSKSKLIWAFPE